MIDIKQKRLLLVEDDALLAMLETRQLEDEGYRVITATSGEKAIDIVCIKKETVDLILMDIDLGIGMDGTETAIEILKNHDIPVVFLSSHTEKEVVQKTEKITSYGYVVKNSGITVLDASIKMAFKLFEANRKTENQKEQLRTILHSIGDAVIATGKDGKIIRMNPVAESLTGWNFDEAEGKPLNEIFNIVNAQTREVVKNPVDLVLTSGKIVGLANHTVLIARDGTEYQIADSGAPIKDAGGQITGVVLVFRDVTQEYEIQSKIEKNEASLSESQRIARVGSWELDLTNFDLKWSKECYSIYELYDDIPSTQLNQLTKSKIHKDDLPKLDELVDNALKKGKDFKYEHRVIMEDNRVKYVSGIAEAVKDISGKVTGYKGTLQDITERKLAEEKLQKLSTELQLIFKNMINAFVVWESVFDENGKYVSFRFGHFNDTYSRISKLKEADVYGKDVFEVWPTTEQSWVEAYGKVAVTGIPNTFEMYHEPTKGWYRCNAYRPTESPSQVCVIFEDITGRNLSEKKLEAAQEVAKIGFWNLDLTDMKLEWSKGLKTIFELSPDDPTPTFDEFWNFVFHEDKEFVDEQVKNQMVPNSKPSINYVYRIITKNGNIKYLEHTGRQSVNNEGKLIELYGSIQDITDNKRVNKELKESEERFRVVFERSTLGKALTSPDGRLIKINQAFANILGYTIEEIQNFNFAEITHPDDLAKSQESIRCLLANEKNSYRIEKRYIHKNGNAIWVDVSTTLLRDKDGSPLYFITSIADITGRKRIEEDLRNLLNEKEIILKEVHHRIKNNMNIILSLLALQANEQEDPAIKKILQDASGNVRSMSVLYDKLYRSETINEISVKEYLSHLINEIVSVFPQKGAVKIKTQIDDIILGPQILSPIGIIINELITNAMNYAFTDHNAGIISVKASKKENLITLIFEDNGIGLPESVSLENSSGFGLNLVGMLAKQLNGSVTIEKQKGTRFILEFTV